MRELSIPSYSYLVPRDHRIKAIMDLYSHTNVQDDAFNKIEDAEVIKNSQPSTGMVPNVMYDLGTLTGNVTFVMTPATTGKINHYYWVFDTDSTAPSVTWPSAITSWANGSAPTMAANKHYEILVLNDIGVYMEV